MHRRIAWAGGLLLGIGLLSIAPPAHALITADYPLKKAIKAMPFIVVARVEKFDAEKQNLVAVVSESLKKDKPPFEKLRITFSQPDDDGKKDDHSAKMMKRLAPNLLLVVFIEKRDDGKYSGMGYTNGTWFQMLCGDPAQQPWVFTHCETYLRRTYKGTTEEMRQAILDAVSGKKDPPPTNPKEAPGFGPEVKPAGSGRAPFTGGPVFGVIPTVAIGGPLAILSMLFPSLFGKPKEILKRYLALMTVASVTSIVYLVHFCVYYYIREYWWGSQLTLWSFMAVCGVLGTVWAFRRYKAMVRSGQIDGLVPQRGEQIALEVLSLIGLAFVPYCLGAGILFKAGWRETVPMWAAVWCGTLGALYLQWKIRKAPEGSKTVFPLEGSMMLGLTVAFTGLGSLFLPSSGAANPGSTTQPHETVANPGGTSEDLPVQNEFGPKLQGVAWTFLVDKPGTMDSTPLVTNKYVYAAVAIHGAFSNPGRVYCIDRSTGKEKWVFHNYGNMKQVFSTPCLADGKLYVGEGYHQDSKCKLYCLDAETGKKLWEFASKSHTESSPSVVNGKVYTGAGDDGVYCLDAATGEQVWQFPGLHVDAIPAVVGDRLYCGSGVGDIYKETAIFCLDAKTGKEVWKVPTELPVWGSPVVDGEQVFFGIGNGNFIEDAEKPAGSLWCVEAKTGKRIWTKDVANGVLARAAVDRQTVYFSSRDGNCYAVDRRDGRLRWKQALGSPVCAAPALGLCPHCGQLQVVYAIASDGIVYGLQPESGAVLWSFDVAKDSQMKPRLFSSPKVMVSNGRRRIYFGTGLEKQEEWTARLYCLEESTPGDKVAEPHAQAKK